MTDYTNENLVEQLRTARDLSDAQFKMLLETFGARIPGTTISFLVEDQKGCMAKIIGDISSHGLFLVTCSVLNGTDSSNKLINIKVSGATESELMDIIKPYAIQIMDVRAYS